MRLIARTFLVFAVAAVSAMAPALAQEWIEYKPTGAGYRIEMPEQPKVATQDVPTEAGPVKTILAIVERGKFAFIVGHNDYPPQALAGRPIDDVLDKVVRGQVGRNTLREQRPITISGRPARAALIDDDQGQVIASYTVMVETRLFQAIYVGPKGTETGDDARRFFDSFALVER